ncbi:MAG: hypothetical protein BroJett015_43680 [Chloroflexota bacterium]|nr:MAG: hypothetical protein BroJett015_43680 [Chloroflexota bacterium]
MALVDGLHKARNRDETEITSSLRKIKHTIREAAAYGNNSVYTNIIVANIYGNCVYSIEHRYHTCNRRTNTSVSKFTHNYPVPVS